jgi:hypothetical protein
MSVRTASVRQRVPEPQPDPPKLYATSATPVLRELLRLSQKLSGRTHGRYPLEQRVSELVTKHAHALGETTASRLLPEYIEDVVQHKGWILDFESLGPLSKADLEAGLMCQVTHQFQSWQVAGIYQRSVNKGKPPLNLGAHIVGGVTLSRFLKIDPNLVLVQPAIDSYTELGCADFYATMRSLMRLLAPLSVK